MKQQHGVNPARRKDLQAAKRYLDRYQRFMHCLGSRSNGSPIGSGIVESACGQILPERLKRSSMPWYHTGARQHPSNPVITISRNAMTGSHA
jgi:hypothetical protein